MEYSFIFLEVKALNVNDLQFGQNILSFDVFFFKS